MDSTTPAVVDTDAISFLFKAHSLAPAYRALLAGRPLAVSLITLAEIEYGMEVKNWGANRRDLMHRFLARLTTLLPDADTARACGRGSKAALRRRAAPLPSLMPGLQQRLYS
jgi:predicted nucleic acid-binding protein